MNDLKPCPFCGGDAVVREYPALGKGFAMCGECNAMVPSKFKKEEVVFDWNDKPSCSVDFCTHDLDNMTPYCCKRCGTKFAFDGTDMPSFCPSCGFEIERVFYDEQMVCGIVPHMTREAMVNGWNANIGRICKVSHVYTLYDCDEHTLTCGHSAIVKQGEDCPNYCPSCGARIVD